MKDDFQAQLAVGSKGEDLVKAWLRHYGHTVISDFSSSRQFQGPRVYGPNGKLIQPDLLAIKDDEAVSKFWVEVKTKQVFGWNRNRKIWTTGIDLDNYLHYIEVSHQTDCDLLVVFLHLKQRSHKYPDFPWPCPTGLFWQWLEKLEATENHRWGAMVYWDSEDLVKECSLGDLHQWKQDQDEGDLLLPVLLEGEMEKPPTESQLVLW